MSQTCLTVPIVYIGNNNTKELFSKYSSFM